MSLNKVLALKMGPFGFLQKSTEDIEPQKSEPRSLGYLLCGVPVLAVKTNLTGGHTFWGVPQLKDKTLLVCLVSSSGDSPM